MGNQIDRKIIERQIASNRVLVIGNNDEGQLGLGHTQRVQHIVSINDKHTTNIYSAARYTIYADTSTQTFHSCGYNEYGECCTSDSGEHITEYHHIDFFRKHNIQISKICTNVCGHCTFWLSSDHRVYVNGKNNLYGRLGLGDRKHRHTPEAIPFFNHSLWRALDIQTTNKYSIALCELNVHSFVQIVRCWSNGRQFPVDIVVLIKILYDNNFNKVFQTRNMYKLETDPNERGRVHSDSDALQTEWIQMDVFKTRNIIKIRTGYEFALFLQSNGIVWSQGLNDKGQLGLGHSKPVHGKPVKLRYFMRQKIKIWELKAGGLHCLAIDTSHRLYAWGYNYYGQLGVGVQTGEEVKGVNRPKCVAYFKYAKVVAIECGYHHSYVKTVGYVHGAVCGYGVFVSREGVMGDTKEVGQLERHYMFGSNLYNECMTFDGRMKVCLPWCIDGVIKQKTYGAKIKRVSLGFENTKIVLGIDDRECGDVIDSFNLTRYGP